MSYIDTAETDSCRQNNAHIDVVIIPGVLPAAIHDHASRVAESEGASSACVFVWAFVCVCVFVCLCLFSMRDLRTYVGRLEVNFSVLLAPVLLFSGLWTAK